MNELVPLFAQGGPADFVFALVMIVILVMGAVQQLIAKARQAQQEQERRVQQQQQQHRQQQQRAQAPPGQGRAQEAPVRDEIGSFLREAAERTGEGRAAAPSAPAADRGVADHVDHSIGQSRMNELRPDLGGQAQSSGGKMAEHLHQVFDHNVSSLSGTPGRSAMPSEPSEAQSPEDYFGGASVAGFGDLGALFTDPVNLRQAILFYEIISRPEHRWGE